MPKYTVRLTRVIEYQIDVEATSADHAIQVAKVDTMIDHEAKGQDRYILHDDWDADSTSTVRHE